MPQCALCVALVLSCAGASISAATPMLHLGKAIADDGACAAGSDCGVSLLQQQARDRLDYAHRRSAKAAVRRGGTSEAPSTMRAVRKSFGGGLKVECVPMPQPGAGEALVKVAASSVNPLDWKLPFPGPAGRDFSGLVVSADASCGVAAGDEVWGDAPSGAWAEYLVVDCGLVGKRPTSIGALEAGVMPHVSLTALQALTVAGAPWSSAVQPVVLVLGGSGGVGSEALQLAKALGAGRIVTTCSPSHFDFVQVKGADQAIDYHTAKWWEVMGHNAVDVVFDTVGDEGTGSLAELVLRANGTFVTLLGSGLSASTRSDVKQQNVVVSETGTKYLDELKGIIDSGKLSATIQTTYSLTEIAQAVAQSKGRHTVGKVAINVTGAPFQPCE